MCNGGKLDEETEFHHLSEMFGVQIHSETHPPTQLTEGTGKYTHTHKEGTSPQELRTGRTHEASMA